MKKLLSAIALLSLTLFAANAQQTEADFVFEPACYGNPTVLTSTSSVHPLDSIVLYAWDLDGDLSFDDAVGAVISHVFPGPDYEHQVGLKITTKFNITKSIYKQVEVSDLDVDFNWVNTCEGDITIFTDLTDVINDNIASWIWEFDTTGPAASIQQNPTYTYPDWGSYIARLTVTTNNGCTDNVDKTIEVFPVPQVTLDPVNMQAVDPSALIPEFSFYEGEVLEIAVNIFGIYTNIRTLETDLYEDGFAADILDTLNEGKWSKARQAEWP